MDINRKEFPIGSLVYYINKYNPKGQLGWSVKYGFVEEHYPGTIVLKLVEPFDCTTINGIPKKELVTPTKWQKLPKGWTYNTELIHFEHDETLFPNCNKAKETKFDIKNPETIINAYKNSWLVEINKNDHSRVETEITKDGWRIIRNFYYSKYVPEFVSLDFRDVYGTYDDAQKVIDAHNAELKHQAELSDYDWSVEQIDKTIDKMITLGADVELANKYKNFILKQENVEDIETRLSSTGGFQWKYCSQKRWKTVEI